jgi:hypothetical protein
VPRRGDDAEAEALQVVLRRGRKRQLVLAPVARAGVDVTDRQAAGPVRRRQREAAAESAKVAKERQPQRSAQA